MRYIKAFPKIAEIAAQTARASHGTETHTKRPQHSNKARQVTADMRLQLKCNECDATKHTAHKTERRGKAEGTPCKAQEV